MASQLSFHAPFLDKQISPASVLRAGPIKINRPNSAHSIQERPNFDRIISSPQQSSTVHPNNLIEVATDAMTVEHDDIDKMTEALKEQLYPQKSLIIKDETKLPTLRKAWTSKGQKEFLATCMSARTRALIERKFGKPSLSQCFKSEATLRHVLAPVFRSGFLDIEDPTDRAAVCALGPHYKDFFNMYDIYKDVDFNPLRDPRRMDIPLQTEIDDTRTSMITAALMFFEGDAGAMVRWLGGLHVSEYRNTSALLGFLRDKVDPNTHRELTRIWTQGIPKYCNAENSERNFQEYYRYGNHSTVDVDPKKLLKTLTKDFSMDHVLIFDERLVPYLLNCHVTPQGMVNIDSPGKKPRCVFDSTFRPTLWAMAINDHTTKDTEPIIREINTELKLMHWFWILRALYPDREIYPMDDDGVTAFRQLKYHPDLVAFHTSVQLGRGVMNTGGTFGDNTTPSNWDVIATARRQVARWLWSNEPNVIAMTRNMIPALSLTPPPTPEEIATFMPAEFDSINRPPLLDSGERLPPPFNHQVDDNLYGDVGDYMERGIACSVLALYIILGFPGPYIKDLNSKEKLDTHCGPERPMVGRLWNTRTMTVGMLDHKREFLISLLTEWTGPKQAFLLEEAAALLGLLENHTRYVRWAKIWMAVLYNEFAALMLQVYHVMHRQWMRDPKKAKHYEAMASGLPNILQFRLKSIIARDKASFLWRTKKKATISSSLRESLLLILRYLHDESRPWSEYIGFVIPRDPHAVTYGDASHLAGGAYCFPMEFWFQVVWNDDIRQRLHVSHKNPTYLHINCLEFVVIILQLAAIVMWIDQTPAEDVTHSFPHGLHPLPIFATGSDNKVSELWANKRFARSKSGQALLYIYCEILRRHRVGHNVFWLGGELNDMADDISRPDPLFLTDASLLEQQIIQRHSCLTTWRRFLPSPELKRSLCSALYTTATLGAHELPNNLGHFVPAGSIGSRLHIL